MEKLKVVVKKPQMAKEEVQMIDHSNEAIQSIVEGYYEAISHPDLKGIVILCNEDGRAKGLAQNLWMENVGIGGAWLLGTIIFVGYDNKGEYIDLTDKQIEDISSFIWD